VDSLKEKEQDYLTQLQHAKTENVELLSKIDAGEKFLKSVSDELLMARAETEKVTILKIIAFTNLFDTWTGPGESGGKEICRHSHKTGGRGNGIAV
jgi:hypothetical protein